jgi:hypothetical protein
MSDARPKRLRPLLATAASLVALAMLLPTSALADFHLVNIREVFPGDSGQADAEYVEFQAYTSGQNFLSGHSVTFYNASGGMVDRPQTFGADVSDGRNQMTFLMATPAAESKFGVVADEGMAANLIDPAGGAVCWASADCVSWGSFRGSLSSPAGAPAAAIPDGMALRRTISPGCATLLEATDDRNNSALDFSPVFPNPRPNSVAPSESACDQSQGGPDNRPGAPQTKLKGKPPKTGHDRTPTFRFSSSEAGSTFQCKIDRKPFKRCRSPFTTKRLAFGRHVFKVRARDAGGQVDPSPASFSFTVGKRR